MQMVVGTSVRNSGQNPPQHLRMHRGAGELTPDITPTVHNLIKAARIHPHAPRHHHTTAYRATRSQRILIQCTP